MSLGLALHAPAQPARAAATVTIVNVDGPGEGLNDVTPVAPVGGNAGVTRGQQRLIALQHAASIWAQSLDSTVEIRISAAFDPLPCDANSAALGQGGSNSIHSNFANAPRANTWYAGALANKIAGFDLNPGATDIDSTFTSAIDGGCALPAHWYYGLNASPPGNDIDLVTIALHEFGHGFGFATYFNESTGVRLAGSDDAFMVELEDHSTGLVATAMNDAQRVTASKDTGDLHWVGANAVGGGAVLSAGRHIPSGHIHMYAPNPVQPGASVSHFSDALFPNEIMEPSYYGPDHSLGLTLDVLRDLGWADCGNGNTEAGEQCDDGNGINGDCCSTTCHFESSSTVCRAAVGACDAAETCTGNSSVCPANTLRPSGASCADDGNPCTVDQCDGVATLCQHPAGNPGATCRAAAGDCDAVESCTGGSATCPADTKKPSATTCTDDGLPCTADLCDGVSNGCQHPAGNGGAVCRAALGVCDLAETCSGANPSCPADAKQPSGTGCADDGNACTIDVCNGASNACQHPAGNAGVVCRAAAGVCDMAETCSGLSPTCPADQFLGSATICRAAVGLCDAVENCSGASANCPADSKLSTSTVCRAAAGACDLAERCPGGSDNCPADGFAPSGSVCRGSAGMCDVAETCSGASTTCPADAKSTAICRAAAGPCDVAEACDGVGINCPANGFASTAVACRAAAGVCDAIEHCDGSSMNCPADAKLPNSAVCRPVAGLCDVEELCSGSTDACPIDRFAAVGVVCRASTAACDLAESCSGLAAGCPNDSGFPDSDLDSVCDGLDNCAQIGNLDQANSDGDAMGDVCDDCSGGVAIVKPRVTVKKLNTLPGDDSLTVSGEITFAFPFSPDVDPLVTGVRLLLRTNIGTALDLIVPAAAFDTISRIGWKVNAKRTRWVYVNPLGLQGVRRIVLTKSTKFPGLLKFKVTGKKGDFSGVDTDLLLTFVIDSPQAASGQCGETNFPGPSPVPLCTFNTLQSVLRCK